MILLPTQLTGRPAGSDRNIAANMALSHQHRNSASSSAANPTSALLNSFLMAKMQQQQNRQQPPPQAPLSMMPPPGLMPTDPAIAFHMSQAQRRPIMKNHATISTHNDPMIMASTYHQRLDQQSQFFDSADNYGSEASHGFRPGSSLHLLLDVNKLSSDLMCIIMPHFENGVSEGLSATPTSWVRALATLARFPAGGGGDLLL